jgi:transcriptional regulator with XRE-family HTH domain
MTVSDRFVLFMRELGLNQKDLGEKIDYPRTNLSNFINGAVKSPKIDLLISLTNVYPNLNLNWLLTGEGEMWNTESKTAEAITDNTTYPASGLKFLGKVVDPSLLKDLFDTKEELIAMQRNRIAALEEELKKCKDRKS